MKRKDAPLVQQRVGAPGRNVADAKGSVVLKAMLYVGGRPVKGNIVRSVTFADARVSDVMRRVRQKLLGQ